MQSKKEYSNAICQWPEEDRPREKLAKYGEHQLSNSELLAILLRTGSKGKSAIDLARQVIDKFKTFRNMSHTDVNDWREFKCSYAVCSRNLLDNIPQIVWIN